MIAYPLRLYNFILVCFIHLVLLVLPHDTCLCCLWEKNTLPWLPDFPGWLPTEHKREANGPGSLYATKQRAKIINLLCFCFYWYLRPSLKKAVCLLFSRFQSLFAIDCWIISGVFSYIYREIRGESEYMRYCSETSNTKSFFPLILEKFYLNQLLSASKIKNKKGSDCVLISTD